MAREAGDVNLPVGELGVDIVYQLEHGAGDQLCRHFIAGSVIYVAVGAHHTQALSGIPHGTCGHVGWCENLQILGGAAFFLAAAAAGLLGKQDQ